MLLSYLLIVNAQDVLLLIICLVFFQIATVVIIVFIQLNMMILIYLRGEQMVLVFRPHFVICMMKSSLYCSFKHHYLLLLWQLLVDAVVNHRMTVMCHCHPSLLGLRLYKLRHLCNLITIYHVSLSLIHI